MSGKVTIIMQIPAILGKEFIYVYLSIDAADWKKNRTLSSVYYGSEIPALYLVLSSVQIR